MIGDIDIGLSFGLLLFTPHFGLGDFSVPCPVMEPTGLSCQGVTAEVIVKVCLADLEPFNSEIYSLTKCTNQVFICIIILTWDDVNNNLGPSKYICFVPRQKMLSSLVKIIYWNVLLGHFFFCV